MGSGAAGADGFLCLCDFLGLDRSTSLCRTLVAHLGGALALAVISALALALASAVTSVPSLADVPLPLPHPHCVQGQSPDPV